MATYTWIGGNNVSWSQADNWNISPSGPTTPPTGSDDVIFVSANNRPCTVTVASVCKNLTIQSGYNSTITLNNNLTVGLEPILTPGPPPTYTPIPTSSISISSTSPTLFTGSGRLVMAGYSARSGVGAIRTISSSAPIYNFAADIASGLSAFTDIPLIVSGTLVVNNIHTAGFLTQVFNTVFWTGAPGSSIILRNKPGEIAVYSPGDQPGVGIGILNSNYSIPFIISGSTAVRRTGRIPFNTIFASGSITQFTGSISAAPNSNIVGSSIFFQPFVSATTPSNFSQSIHVNADARLLFTTSSYWYFRPVRDIELHMSGSGEVNKLNGLNLYADSGTGLKISSDVYLTQNTTLPDPTNASRQFTVGSLGLGGLGNANIISTIGGQRNIFVGGNIYNIFSIAPPSYPPGTWSPSPGHILSNTRYNAGGPKVVMYGTGYIGFPPNGAANTPNFGTIGLGIDFDISSSGTVRWGCNSLSYNIASGFIANTPVTSYPTWSYVTAQNYAALSSSTLIFNPVVIDFKNNPIWDLNPRNTTAFLSSSLVCSGSLYTSPGIATLNSNSITNPSLTVLQNVFSTTSFASSPANSLNLPGQLRGNIPITMSGNLPATYSLLVPLNNGKGNDITVNKPNDTPVLITNQFSSSGVAPNNILFPIPLTYDSGTFTYIAGNVNTSDSTLSLGNSASMNTTNNLSWYNIRVSGSTSTPRGSLINIISPLVISNELNLGAAGNVTFTGSDTWQCSRLICTTPGRRITLQNAVSNGQKAYTTTTFVNLSSSGAPISMSSDLIGTRASWSVDLNSPPVQLYNIDGIWIDSSGGRTIWTTGVTQSTINWNPGLAPSTPLGSLYTFFID
jgi:hypothetical protein